MPTNSGLDNLAIQQFLDGLWMERGVSKNTIDAYKSDLHQAEQLISSAGGTLIHAEKPDLLSVISQKMADGAKPRSIARFISSLRQFFQYRIRMGLCNQDPTALIDSPKVSKAVPNILDEAQIEKLLTMPDQSTPIGVRDKAMLELMYATGIRVTELITLTIDRVSLNTKTLSVVGHGKHSERLIPLIDTACDYLNKYMFNARLQLHVDAANSTELFITNRGKAMTRQAFWYAIKRYAADAGIKQKLSPSTLRHSFAAHLLSHGADLQVVQQMLGHQDLSTVQDFTPINDAELKDIHALLHPNE